MVTDNGIIFMIFISLLFFFGPGAIYLIDLWAHWKIEKPPGTHLPQGT